MCAAALCALALTFAGTDAAAQGDLAEAQIVVTGEGQVAAAPDMATITLGVQREAGTAQGAVSEMSDAARSVLDAVVAAGVAPADVQTSGLRLSPRFAPQDGPRQGPPEVVGYVAETVVTVRVVDLAGLGGVLDSVVAAGANLFRGLSFGIAEPGPLRDEARQLAVLDGARQAALLAEAANVGLGRLVRIETESAALPPQMMRSDMAMAEMSGVPVSEGEVTLNARVRLIYAITAR
ncbi:MAG: SIMPL domain-containing protein [Pseudomonadota bacterium]